MNYIYSQDIATMGICSSQGQPRSTIVMFVTIQQYGYVHHKRICLSLCDNMVMFITLQQYGYGEAWSSMKKKCQTLLTIVNHGQP